MGNPPVWEADKKPNGFPYQRQKQGGLLIFPLPDIDEPASDGGGSGHGRADQMRPAARALSALEIAVGRGGAALARLKPIRIHRQAHTTARLSPLETRFEEDAV